MSRWTRRRNPLGMDLGLLALGAAAGGIGVVLYNEKKAAAAATPASSTISLPQVAPILNVILSAAQQPYHVIAGTVVVLRPSSGQILTITPDPTMAAAILPAVAPDGTSGTITTLMPTPAVQTIVVGWRDSSGTPAQTQILLTVTST